MRGSVFPQCFNRKKCLYFKTKSPPNIYKICCKVLVLNCYVTLFTIYCLVALPTVWDYNDLEGKTRVYLSFLLNFPVDMFQMKEFKLFSYLFTFLLINLFVTLSKLPPNFLYHYWVLRLLNGFYRFIWLCFL